MVGSWARCGLGALALVSSGCGALLDIDEIEFGDATAPAGPGAGAAPATSTGGTGGATNGSGGAPAGELCNNGEDDDGDGLLDCADDECAASTCVDEPPSGWALVAAGDAPSGCNTGWPTESSAGEGALLAPAASCSDCTCATPTGGTCEFPTLTFYNSDVCGGSFVTAVPTAVDVCLVGGEGITDSVRGDAIVVTGGSCLAAGGDATTEDASFEQSATLCTGASFGGGCRGAQLCAPAPPSGLSVCIQQAGDVSCPAGPYQERRVVYGDIDDQRDCEACTCGAPAGSTCTAHSNVYKNSGCAVLVETVPHDGSCTVTNEGVSAYIYTLDSGPDGGSCTPSVPAPTGTASPIDPVTVCCL